MRRWLSCIGLLVSALLASDAADGPARAQSAAAASQALDFKKSGVRFEIKAALRADAPADQKALHQATASLTVKLRISAHAREANFFGEVTREFPSFPLLDGAGELPVWGEDRCHQRRGLPKVTVVAIDGAIASDKQETKVKARPRHLGLMLPADEISQGAPLPAAGQNGAALAFRSRSKSSRLAVDVRIYAFDCALLAGEPAPAR